MHCTYVTQEKDGEIGHISSLWKGRAQCVAALAEISRYMAVGWIVELCGVIKCVVIWCGVVWWNGMCCDAMRCDEMLWYVLWCGVVCYDDRIVSKGKLCYQQCIWYQVFKRTINSLIMVILLILRFSHTQIDIDAESITIKTTCD